MSLWKVAWRSIQQRALVSLLTVLSMGLGVALVVAVLVVYSVVYQSFRRGGEGYDLIVGAKGGKEQLVLNTVFYLSQPIGNIPYSFYEELTEGKFAADVEAAIPVCMGHTYQGFRVMGTVPEMFTELKYQGNKSYEFAAGENFKAENHFDAVVGATAAAKAGLQVGDKFQAVHGSGEGGVVHKESFRVAGVLAPTSTPMDRAIYVNMEGFQDIHHGRKMKPRTRSKKSTKRTACRPNMEKRKNTLRKTSTEQITAILLCIRQVPPGMRRRGGQMDQRRQSGPGRGAWPRHRRTFRGHCRETAMDPVGDGRADGRRGRHRHHGEHLQLDERPAARNCRHAGLGPAASS